jgi:hypothetical protein
VKKISVLTGLSLWLMRELNGSLALKFTLYKRMNEYTCDYCTFYWLYHLFTVSNVILPKLIFICILTTFHVMDDSNLTIDKSLIHLLMWNIFSKYLKCFEWSDCHSSFLTELFCDLLCQGRIELNKHHCRSIMKQYRFSFKLSSWKLALNS